MQKRIVGKAQFLCVLPLRKSGRNGRRRGTVYFKGKGIPSIDPSPLSGRMRKMRKAVTIGDWVKFVGIDGQKVYCRVTALKLDERSRIMAILEAQHGPKKGCVGSFPAVQIRWDGKMFIADARKEEEKWQ